MDLALQQTVNGGYTTAIRLHLENFGALSGWVLQVANDPFFGEQRPGWHLQPAPVSRASARSLAGRGLHRRRRG